MLFNIYFHHIPATTVDGPLARKQEWGEVKTLEEDILAIKGYLQQWCLKLSVAKTTASAFHLNNKEADRDLDV